jgi:hypothetical protein
MTIEDLSGWIGALLVLIAYYMVSSGKAKAESINFQLINIIGAAFLIYYTYACQAYASMTVNIIWVGIGFSSLTKYIKFHTKMFVKSLNFKHKLSRLKLEKVRL